MAHNTEVVRYSGKILAQSKAAVLFCIVPEGQEYKEECKGDYDSVWFPLSQTKELHTTYSIVNDTLDSIVVTLWIAKQKDLV